MALTLALIKHLAGETIFLRGEEYHRAGMVRSLTWKDDRAHAEVHGSKRRPYKVVVSFRHGRPLVRCSCPHGTAGVFCKHSVALLLYLMDLGETGESGDSSDEGEFDDKNEGAAKVTQESALADSGIGAFLSSIDTPVRFRIGLTVKGLRTTAKAGIPFSLIIEYRSCLIPVTDIVDLLGDAFLSDDKLPSLSALTSAQYHFLHVLGGFLREPDAVGEVVLWRLLPFQLGILLDLVSRTDGIEIVEPRTGQSFVFSKDPPVGLRLAVRSPSTDLIVVKAELMDPLYPQHVWTKADVILGNGVWLFHEPTLSFRLFDPRIEERMLTYFLQEEQALSSIERQHFLIAALPRLREAVLIEADDTKVCDVRLETHAFRPRYEIDVKHGDLELALKFIYGKGSVRYARNETEAYVEWMDDQGSVFVRRDLVREEEVAHALINVCHGVFDEAGCVFHFTSSEDMFEFLSVHSKMLAEAGDVFLSEQARALYKGTLGLNARVRVSSLGIDWFSYDISYNRDGKELDIPFEMLQEHLSSGKKFIRLKTGEFIPLNADAFGRIGNIFEERDRQNKLMLAHIPFVMDELRSKGVIVEVDAETERLYEELKCFKGIDAVEMPEAVAGVLRDYQRHGVNWLSFIRKFRFGGILADEMGLGKTLQTLAMVCQAREAGVKLPCLVVCPTTLVWNWEAEVKKFLPGTKTLVIGGNDRRTRLEKIPEMEIVITSYALLRRDIECYAPYHFYYLVLDEAQNIKNRHTLSAQVTKRLKADHRLALSGTPLENSIADLWSIFDFLMPSFLGTYERFREIYEMPIVQGQDHSRLTELSRRIAPFVLRRLKQDVIKELPEKIEQTAFCELEPAQAKLYASMADQARKEALDAYKSKGLGKSRMLILTLLLRLRQICCHPQIAGVSLKHHIGVSAKTDLFKEMLQELLSSGHRVLVFSQFVEMLKILKEYLEHEKIDFEYMDGKTKNRQERVEHFNVDKEVKVFLLSLKVGGLGLNLTSADTVILYEPWWNPAVEQQAIDRAHRMGQKNSVLAYHLIARGTIEERILELQERKKLMMNTLVLSDETVFKSLGWDDIKFLLDLKE